MMGRYHSKVRGMIALPSTRNSYDRRYHLGSLLPDHKVQVHVLYYFLPYPVPVTPYRKGGARLQRASITRHDW